MKKLNILVTGAGSGVGQSIIKALRFQKLSVILFLQTWIIPTLLYSERINQL